MGNPIKNMGFNDYNYNADEGAPIAADFNDSDTRKNFSKKVLALTGIQLLITFGGVGTVSMLHKEDGSGSVNYGEGLFQPWMIWTSIALSITMLIAGICCCSGLLRKSPHNLIFLFVWTLLETHLVSTVGLIYDTKTITSAMGATAGTVLVVAALGAFTKFDFSKLLPIMGAVLICWCLVVFISLLMHMRWNKTLYACIGVTIFTIFLAIDLKMMMGGGRFEYGEDDYVLAAINIYLDIINIF